MAALAHAMSPRLLGLRLAAAAAAPSVVAVTPRVALMLPAIAFATGATTKHRSMTSATARRPSIGLSTSVLTMRSLSPKTESIVLKCIATRSSFTCQQRSQSTAAAELASSMQPGSSTAQASSTPLVSKRIVALHLYALAFLVYAIVVVGGLTRLTESGLSITEWNPGFKGMRLPMTTPEWQAEWDKYKQTPEFLLLNSKMSLDDFKSIYMWEWGHRVLGRVIGVAFVLPAAFFVTRRWVAAGTRWKLLAIAAGIGFQGFLGWFMVESGLTAPQAGNSDKPKMASVSVPVMRDDHPNSTADTDGGRIRFDATVAAEQSTSTLSSQTTVAAAAADWTPRVSHFRLAMHMGTAFLVYLAMLHTGLAVQRDYNTATMSGHVSGVRARSQAALEQLANTLNHPLLRSHSRLTKLVAGLVFTTAMSGALVAGLDAGLVYNEFPTMGDGRIAPPMHELIDDRFAQRADRSDKVWRNLTQNPVTVQLIHRTLAITTATTVVLLAWRTHRLNRTYAAAAANMAKSSSLASCSLLPSLPPRLLSLANISVGVVALQVTLGITTLIYLVPIPLASAHQAGSLALLSVLLASISALRPIPTAILAALRSGNSHVLSRSTSSSSSLHAHTLKRVRA